MSMLHAGLISSSRSPDTFCCQPVTYLTGSDIFVLGGKAAGV